MIEIKGLTKDYGRIRAVDDLHLRIEQGEIFGLLGPNGAGKTTTVRMLTMLARPTAGEAYIAGCEVQRGLARMRQEIGVVPQHMNLDQELTARENLELHGRLYKMPAAERRKRVEELLFFVDLQEREGELVSRFSGGMKRRFDDRTGANAPAARPFPGRTDRGSRPADQAADVGPGPPDEPGRRYRPPYYALH